MGVLGVAVVSWGWVCNRSGFSIYKRESFIKVWAVLKRSNIRSNILLLAHLIVFIAVEVDLWEWDGSSFSIGKSESLVKVWAMLQ